MTHLLPPPSHELGDLFALDWRIETDGEAFEYRERIEAIAWCPECGTEVELVAETDAWVEEIGPDGRRRWAHDGYGPAMGEHCNVLLADWWDGTFAYQLPAQATA